MKISINTILSEDSAVRGIGSYNQMLTEAIEAYGKAQNLSLSPDGPINLITDFNFFVEFNLKQNAKNILVLHDLIPLEFPRHFPIGIRGKWQLFKNSNRLKKLDGIITDTEWVKSRINQVLKIPLSKIAVVPPSAKRLFEEDSSKPSKLEFSLPKDYLLYVGDITWNKNLPNLAVAVKQINQPLVMVGSALTNQRESTHPWLSSYHQFLELTKDSGLFRFPGFVTESQLKFLYQNTAAIVSPSWAEGFGLPWLEGAWSETPAVLGKTAAVEEVAGDTAIYVDPAQPESIAQGIKIVLGKEGKELGRRARKRAVDLYRQERFVVKLREALYNLL